MIDFVLKVKEGELFHAFWALEMALFIFSALLFEAFRADKVLAGQLAWLDHEVHAHRAEGIVRGLVVRDFVTNFETPT